jgi:hypothetical protein
MIRLTIIPILFFIATVAAAAYNIFYLTVLFSFALLLVCVITSKVLHSLGSGLESKIKAIEEQNTEDQNL